MNSLITRTARLAAVTVLAAAILAPVAGAGRSSIAASPAQATCHQYCGVEHYRTRLTTTRSLLRTELVRAPAGFDWADAAIGFGIGIGAMSLVFAVGTGIRHLRPANTAS
jgi:hypothetical protein